MTSRLLDQQHALEAPLILVVEDEADLREVVCTILKDEGYEVVSASDGRQALDMIRATVPALIVLDMGLPIISGEEVAATLRDTLAKPPPILVMSAAGTLAERARRIGAAGYIAKPFGLNDLIEAVRGVLSTPAGMP